MIIAFTGDGGDYMGVLLDHGSLDLHHFLRVRPSRHGSVIIEYALLLQDSISSAGLEDLMDDTRAIWRLQPSEAEVHWQDFFPRFGKIMKWDERKRSLEATEDM